MIFIDGVKSKLLCWQQELTQNAFGWTDTENCGGLALCNNELRCDVPIVSHYT